jgi:hypothetical protein
LSYNYRCSRTGCRARITLKQRIVIGRKCPSCKKDTLKDCTATERARTKRRTCKCDGYHFPHSVGTEPWCVHSKRVPTDDEHRDRSG